MRLLYLEPFDTGSHAAFTTTVTRGIDADWTVLTMPGRHWKWRMRGCAATWSLTHAEALGGAYDAVLASAFVPWAELRGLVPSLAAARGVVYFHENQAAYPDRNAVERDHHFALTQLVSALAADEVLFNSRYNSDSFLDHSRKLLDQMPEKPPASWLADIERKARVVGYPCPFVDTAPAADPPPGAARAAGPLLLWNHRWEHDKDPDALFACLTRLHAADVPFRLAVCGERFRRRPACFDTARIALEARIEQWGPLPRDEYERLLGHCQVVLSTARHEFFGKSVLEAVHAGARALVPDALAYPDLLPAAMRYGSAAEFAERLAAWCQAWTRGETNLRADHRALTLPHTAAHVLPRITAALKGTPPP